MASICLLVGVAFGFLFRGSASAPVQTSVPTQASPANLQQQMPTLEQMKAIADKQAEPLLAKLKADPKNSALLNQVGTIYKATHQFKTAIDYYQKAVEADPKNVPARTDLASCLYYEGDVASALRQLQQSLSINPKDANSLFNLGMIEWKGKGNPKGAAKAWEQLLRANPELDKQKKAEVEGLIAEVRK